MKSIIGKLVYSAVLCYLAFGGVANAETWDGGGANNEYSTALNWNNDVIPTNNTGDINGAYTVERSVDITVNRTFVQGGATLNVTGGTHSDSQVGNNIRNFVGFGSEGTVNQSGGSWNIGHILIVGGSNASGDGTYNLTDGDLIIGRGGNSFMGVSGGSSIEIGVGGATGLFNLSGGSLATRIGVGVGAQGTFSVQGNGAGSIGIGSSGSLDGDWNQSAGGTLRVGIDLGGVTKILIDDEGDDGGAYAIFENGSLLDVDYYSAGTGGGTWTVLEVEGTNIVDHGLAFASGVDTNIWSFAVDNTGANGLLTVTAAGSAPGRTAVTVSSFVDLNLYLNADNHDVTMTPGTYRVTTADCGTDGSGLFPTTPILNFTGTNSVYDFTGVTFEFETEILQSFGNVDVKEIAVMGDDLVLKNLTMTDIGNTRPRRTALGVLLDGRRNRVEGFNMTVRGSQPYGYGDIFGKGSGYVIKHFKHSAILIRGEDNHLLNCKVFHRAYGHGIFCQGSQDAIIEGCYVEGETRTTDDVLAEAGSGSAADDVGFRTNWGEDENGENGYVLQPGWMFSCQEDGIRAYNTGVGLDGSTSVNTRNMQVIDCTVYKMRGGVTIGFCDNTKYVENCVMLNTEGGYWVGTEGEIVDSAGNAPYGPLLSDAYQHNRDTVVDLTVLDNAGRYGNEILTYAGGSGHHVTLHSRNETVDPNLNIMLAGIKEGMRQYVVNPTYNDFTLSNMDLYNYTQYPVVMAAKSSGTAGQTGGSITDYGSGNSLTPIAVNSAGGFGVLQTIEAEDFSSWSGTSIQTRGDGVRFIGAANDGDWVCFEDFFMGSGPNRFEARVAGGSVGGDIELRLDSVGGALLGTCSVASNATPGSWLLETIALDEPRGKRDLYLVFKGTTGSMPELERFRFYVEFPGWEESKGLVGHWKFDDGSGTTATDSSGYGHHGTMANAAWVTGKKGGALDFDGSSSTVSIPASAFNSIREEITIAFWAYGDTAVQPANDSIFHAADGSDPMLNIHLPYGDSRIYWDAGSASGYDRIDKAASAAEFEGTWAHWVFTKNSNTGHMRIYRNGVIWHHAAYLAEEISGIVAAAIGSQSGGVSSYSGMIDDVRLYDVELMEHEVTELYDSYSYTDAGTPYSWLDDHGLVAGGDYESADQLDADTDGTLNGEEFRSGTNPTNDTSVFRIVSTDASGSQMTFDWSAVAGKTYAVWQKTGLVDDAWQLQEDAIPGTEPSCTSTVLTDNASGFIQVEVEP